MHSSKTGDWHVVNRWSVFKRTGKDTFLEAIHWPKKESFMNLERVLSRIHFAVIMGFSKHLLWRTAFRNESFSQLMNWVSRLLSTHWNSNSKGFPSSFRSFASSYYCFYSGKFSKLTSSSPSSFLLFLMIRMAKNWLTPTWNSALVFPVGILWIEDVQNLFPKASQMCVIF